MASSGYGHIDPSRSRFAGIHGPVTDHEESPRLLYATIFASSLVVAMAIFFGFSKYADSLDELSALVKADQERCYIVSEE